MTVSFSFIKEPINQRSSVSGHTVTIIRKVIATYYTLRTVFPQNMQTKVFKQKSLILKSPLNQPVKSITELFLLFADSRFAP